MKKIALFMAGIVLAASLFMMTGCGGDEVKLDPKNPITISVWHYYNGAIMNSFNELITLFNETVGLEKGIIVEGFGVGNVTELETAVIASANKEVGSSDMPNIFASYADTAYEAENLGILANLDDYFKKEEQKEYLTSFIEEGKIGLNGELRIFPIAKSTEIFMLNDTDWKQFADENGYTYSDLSTIEGLHKVAESYYNWTDEKTPDVKNDGKAFFGRDSMANLFIIASKEFDVEIFTSEKGVGKINADESVMRKIWDNYYVPYISGYFLSNGKFRSDDTKVGDVISYVGSSSSSAYFPKQVYTETEPYDVEAKVLPVPHFESGKNAMVQQGAGMVVTKSTKEEEYASVEFLKWFTNVENNSLFSGRSGYMPVKVSSANYDSIKPILDENGVELDKVTEETLKITLDEIKTSTLYTTKAFKGGVAARAILENDLQDKATADREQVKALLESGTELKDAVSEFNTDEAFKSWYDSFVEKLNAAAE